MLKHYSKQSELKYLELKKANPDFKISGTRYFEWTNDTVLEFTCKYGHVTEREIRHIRGPIICRCDKCKKDRGYTPVIKKANPTDKAGKIKLKRAKYKAYRTKVCLAARKLANKYIKDNKLNIPTSIGELKKPKNKALRIKYHILTCKFAHDSYYKYNVEQITKELESSASNKITVTCPEHGEFKIRMQDHYCGTACPKCYKEGKRVKVVRSDNKKPTEASIKRRVEHRKAVVKAGRAAAAKYIIKNNIDLPTDLQRMRKFSDREKRIRYHIIVCQMIHNFYYEYDLQAWLEADNIRTDKMPIKCPVHGVFYMKLSDHYTGSVCGECSARGSRTKGRKVTIPLDIEKTF